MLQPYYEKNQLEAGCDEAGRGCLAGPVFAAAVILPPVFDPLQLNDSKQLEAVTREKLRTYIETAALSWGVAFADHHEVDMHNILQASFLAMHRAIAKLHPRPGLLLIDGNRFRPYKRIPHHCIVKGDSLYMSIAAASILAKTHRDAYMQKLHEQYPHYHWDSNKGYPTPPHRRAILKHGISPFHRKSYNLYPQGKLFAEQ